MATITESLERSLQNCSLNNHQRSTSVNLGLSAEEGTGRSSSSGENNLHNTDTTLELNSHLSLPYHWEQCLDLKVKTFLLLELSKQNQKKKKNQADLVLSVLLSETGIILYFNGFSSLFCIYYFSVRSLFVRHNL